jgi:hypothetical protein
MMSGTAIPDGGAGTFLVPTGFEDAKDFRECWNKVYMFIANENAIPQLVFADNDNILKGLRGRTISIQNGSWVPRDGSPQSILLCFIEHKGEEKEQLFNVMTLDNGTGEVVVMTTDTKTLFTEDDRLIVESCVISLKEYLRVVPVAKHTSH